MPPFQIRGVIEGFYGRPWTPRDRREVVTFMKQRGFNEYVYAPKDDPYHRKRWREPYPKVEMITFDDVLSYLRHGAVRFVFGLSPGLDIVYSDPQDEAAIWRKWDVLWERGVRRFLLALDDVDPVLRPADAAAYGEGPAALGRAQGELVARLWEAGRARDPEFRLYFCPTEYHGTEPTPYRAALAATVPAEVPIIWTGPRVVSPEIRADDARAIARVLGRPPLIWDNYPVNDFRPERLFLGPIRGREAALAESCLGVWINPMVQATASELALHTWDLFLTAPEAYDPQAAWEDAARAIGGRHAWEALLRFAELNQSSRLWDAEAPRLKAALDAFWAAFEAGEAARLDAACVDLDRMWEEIASLPEELEAHLPRRDLYGELRPWLERLAAEVDLARRALEALRRHAAHGGAAAGAAREDAAVGAGAAGAGVAGGAGVSAELRAALEALPAGRVVAEGMIAGFVRRAAEVLV
ncbi:MAG: beta-N-acetylglucosaminidase domain-containing protein [Firmicutes bacterium]|nr:beta-N-acetylglucosaminidase domain-containing protein [Bacillota bacterium]